MVEGARLESVCTGYRTEGSNPSLSAIKSAANSGFFIASLWDRKFGSCAMGACEPGQVRKEAALSGYFHVPRGRPDLRPYREVSSAELSLGAFCVYKGFAHGLLKWGRTEGKSGRGSARLKLASD